VLDTANDQRLCRITLLEKQRHFMTYVVLGQDRGGAGLSAGVFGIAGEGYQGDTAVIEANEDTDHHSIQSGSWAICRLCLRHDFYDFITHCYIPPTLTI
jgi:hypothetical protein